MDIHFRLTPPARYRVSLPILSPGNRGGLKDKVSTIPFLKIMIFDCQILLEMPRITDGFYNVINEFGTETNYD